MPDFWTKISCELFTNVYSLHESFDAWFSLRAPDGGTPLTRSILRLYLRITQPPISRNGRSCVRSLQRGAEFNLNRSLEVLAALNDRPPPGLKGVEMRCRKSSRALAKGKKKGSRCCRQMSLVAGERNFDVSAATSAAVQGKELGFGRGAGKTRCGCEWWKFKPACGV